MRTAYPPTFSDQTPRGPRRLVSLAVFADHADVSQKTIRRRISEGVLPAYRVGKLIKLDLADLDRIAQRIPTAHLAGGDRDVA